jgi:F-type H+-transporting ATPase subunit a
MSKAVGAVASAQKHAEAAHHGGGGVTDIIAHHINDSAPFVKIPTFHIGSLAVDLSITKFVVLLWVAAILVLVMGLIGRRIAKNPLSRPSRASGFIEVFVLFVRDDIVKEHIGKHGLHLTPYFISLFLFILFANFLGLIPGSATTTGNIAVTAGLSVLSFVLVQFEGMRNQGWFAYWKNIVPKGVPLPLWLIMWPIEFVGLFAKPFALTIRLFANMTAGHVVIIVLLFLIFKFQAIWVAPLSVLGALGVNLLEVFICLIQAYIFVALTALFVGLASHRH